MDFDGGYISYGKVNETLFKALLIKVSALSLSEWMSDTRRQTMFKVHKDTQSIILKFTNEPYGEWEDAWFEWQDVIEPVMNDVLQSGFGVESGHYVKVILAYMPGNSSIAEHKDLSVEWEVSRRIHVPIITNPDVSFIVDSIKVPMLPGISYDIANTRLHSVDNKSDSYRVHLIFDYVDANLAGKKEWDEEIRKRNALRVTTSR